MFRDRTKFPFDHPEGSAIKVGTSEIVIVD